MFCDWILNLNLLILSLFWLICRCALIVILKTQLGHLLPMGFSSASIAPLFIVALVYISASSGILAAFFSPKDKKEYMNNVLVFN